MDFQKLSGDDGRIATALLQKDYQITALLAADLARTLQYPVTRTPTGVSITLPDGRPPLSWDLPADVLDAAKELPLQEEPTTPTSLKDRWGTLGDFLELSDRDLFSYKAVALVVEPDRKLVDEYVPNGSPNRAPKREDEDEDEEKEWSTAYINDLPDSAFLYIAEGGEKDEEGKTAPRALRKLPYRDKDGKIDLPHLRNAISRANQVKDAEGNTIPEEQVEKIRARARKILDENTSEKGVTNKDNCVIMSPEESVLSKAIQTVKNLFQKKTPDISAPLFTIKDGSRYRWVSVSSTAFKDREDDIISREAYQKDVQPREGEDYGPLLFWHLPIELGRCDFRMVDGVCMVESGLWDDGPMGTAARKELAKDPHTWGISLGFLYDSSTAEKNIVIEGQTVRNLIRDIKTVERSVLPVDQAAALFTMIASEEEGEHQMDQKKKEALHRLLGSDELVGTVEQHLDSINAKALSGDILFKDVETLQEKLLVLSSHIEEQEPTIAKLLKEASGHAEDPALIGVLLETIQSVAGEELGAVVESLIPKEKDGEAEVEAAKETAKEEEEDEEDEDEDKPKASVKETEDNTSLAEAVVQMAKEFASLKKAFEDRDSPAAADFFRPTSDPSTEIEADKKELDQSDPQSTVVAAMAKALIGQLGEEN